MAKTKISEFSATPANNTDIDSINIAEGCAPSGINDAIRELMAQLKDFQTGAVGDSFNGPVGTTTAAAGAFTTLSASGAVTLSGGTANGVAYLNGSKVVTSGSALTFDGTNFGTTGNANLGSGSKSTDTQINLLADTGTQRIYIERGSRSLVFYDVGAAIENYRIAGITGIQTWGVGGSEQMRLTSTGLGIGTSSPQAKVHSSGSGTVSNYITSSDSGGVNLYLQVSGSAANIGSPNGIPLTFTTSNTVKATLDTSGNLGLGVTPSAWATVTAMQVKATSIGGYSSTGYLNANAYYNAGWKYINTLPAARYEINAGDTGAHQWFTAPSGTAGNAITFTQAMTLDASGRLGVGVTSPAQKIHTDGRIRVSTDNSNGGDIAVDSSGLALSTLGTTQPIVFLRNNYATESARIDSSGNLLVGTTSTYGGPGRINVGFNQSSNFGITLRNTSATATGVFVSFENSSGGGNGSISQTNSTTIAYNTSSDRRLKTNIVSASDAGSDIDAINVVSHGWVSNDDTVKYGVIAQELFNVAPQAVRKGDDGAEVTETWGVDYSKLVPMLVKEIQSLRQRLSAAGL